MAPMIRPLGRKPRSFTEISGFRRLLIYMERMAATIWPITVATAAPATPMSRVKMQMGSKMMLITAPNPWVSMV